MSNFSERIIINPYPSADKKRIYTDEIWQTIGPKGFLNIPKKNIFDIVQSAVRKIIKNPNELYVIPTLGTGSKINIGYTYIYEKILKEVLDSKVSGYIVRCGALQESVSCKIPGVHATHSIIPVQYLGMELGSEIKKHMLPEQIFAKNNSLDLLIRSPIPEPE